MPTKCSTLGLCIDTGSVCLNRYIKSSTVCNMTMLSFGNTPTTTLMFSTSTITKHSSERCLLSYVLKVGTQVPMCILGTTLPLYSETLSHGAVVLWVQTMKCADRQPWPPPISLEILFDSFMIRPVPWPNFIVSAVFVGGFKSSLLLSSADRLMVQPASILELLGFVPNDGKLCWEITWSVPLVEVLHRSATTSFVATEWDFLTAGTIELEVKNKSYDGGEREKQWWRIPLESDFLVKRWLGSTLRIVLGYESINASQILNSVHVRTVRPLPWPSFYYLDAWEHYRSVAAYDYKLSQDLGGAYGAMANAIGTIQSRYGLFDLHMLWDPGGVKLVCKQGIKCGAIERLLHWPSSNMEFLNNIIGRSVCFGCAELLVSPAIISGADKIYIQSSSRGVVVIFLGRTWLPGHNMILFKYFGADTCMLLSIDGSKEQLMYDGNSVEVENFQPAYIVRLLHTSLISRIDEVGKSVIADLCVVKGEASTLVDDKRDYVMLLLIAGTPYDKLEVIGIRCYREVPFAEDGGPDRDTPACAISPETGCAFIQRSCGYS